MDLCLQRALQKSDLLINGLHGFVFHTMSRDETVTSWRWNNGSQEFSTLPACFIVVSVFSGLICKHKIICSQNVVAESLKKLWIEESELQKAAVVFINDPRSADHTFFDKHNNYVQFYICHKGTFCFYFDIKEYLSFL